MSVNDLAELLAGGGAGRERLQLIDVREDGEHAAAALPGFQLLPLSRRAQGPHLHLDKLYEAKRKRLKPLVLLKTYTGRANNGCIRAPNLIQ